MEITPVHINIHIDCIVVVGFIIFYVEQYNTATLTYRHSLISYTNVPVNVAVNLKFEY